MKIIKLKSFDGDIIEVEEDVARLSQIISDAMDNTAGVIPLPNVTTKILKKVIDYMTKHAVETDENKSAGDDDDALLKAFDEEFLAVDKDTLFELIRAANYLDVKKLLDLTCQAVADMIKGMTAPEQIREAFGIENDFTKEEEEAVRKETPWAFK